MVKQDNPDEYNGWQNFETWNIALWIGNDCQLHNATLAVAKSKTLGRAEKADRIRQWFELEAEKTVSPSSWQTDLLGHALSRVNWDEIVSNYETQE